MCGIAGILTNAGVPAEALQATALAMGERLVHRGPDAGTSWIDDGIGLAHRRLAVIDTSATGAQPMHSGSGRWVVAYNGEIYNHRALRAQLEQEGVRFRGHSDTETLVEAIAAWGVDRTLERTNGMFAFAAWDRTTRRLVLVRDRLGEKPLYWAVAGDRLLWASELKGLRAVPGLNLTIDPAAMGALLRWGFVPHPGTIYEGVRQLPPGHLLEARVANGTVEVTERAWWRLGDTVRASLRQRQPSSLGEAAEELRPLLANAVGERLESDVPLGSFLSGGIDSSIVAAFAQQALGSTPLRTFTVKMPELGFDESAHAAAVARHLGTEHTEVKLPVADMLAAVQQLAGVWDEPFADPSMLPSMLLCRAVRQDLTVCLAGDGGDEVFAGYNRHALGTSLWRRVRWLPRPVRHGLARTLLAPAPATLDRWGAWAQRVLPERLRLPNVGDKVQKAATVMRGDADLWASLAQIWPRDALPDGVAPVAIGPETPLLDPIEEMMYADTSVVLPDQMLVKVDRASMAASLEVRSPLLDHRLLEWSWRQPLDVKTKGGVGKLVLREALRGMVPEAIAERPKMGFDPPLATWLRGPLRDWAGDLVAGSRAVANGWLDGAALADTWQQHQRGARNFDYRLWAVLMLESWLREYA